MESDQTPGERTQQRYEDAVSRLDALDEMPGDDGPPLDAYDDMADQNHGTAKKDRKSASTELVEIAMQRYRFGVSNLGETFALPKAGDKVVSMLRGSKSSLRNVLAREYFRLHRRAAPQQALADALLVIEGIAQEDDEAELYLRVAPAEGGAWLDMGDQSGRAIRITADGWSIEKTPPVLFKRTALNSALPEPERDGDLNALWSRLNVTEADRPLMAAWLVSVLITEMPHPVLCFFGEQGTGKTTAQKMLVSVLDPGPVPTRKPPRDAESWVTAAAGSWVVGLDNLSDVQPWLSDSICRAVTGDGDVRRKLYTDGEHAVFAFRRCVCLNSIDLGAVRGDLAERMLPITLEPISESARLGEDEIWPSWHKAHPKVLGAILDLTASVIHGFPSVELASKPRMADFARILAAVDSVLGTDGLAHYLGKQGAMASDSLTGDPFIQAVETLGHFEGTAADLLEHVARDKPPKGWPGTARAVTQRLRRQAPVMRKAGWTVQDDGGRNHSHAVIWTLRAPNHTEIACNPDSPTSQTRSDGAERELASHASHEYGPSPYDDLIDAAREGTELTRDRARELLSHDLDDLVAGTLPVAAARHFLEQAS